MPNATFDQRSPDISSNFSFLAEHDPIFLQLALTAEQVFAADPNTTLIKLRQLGEALAQDIAARAGIEFDRETTQADLLFRLNREIRLDPTVREMFHTLRIEGNKATHQFRVIAPMNKGVHGVEITGGYWDGVGAPVLRNVDDEPVTC